MASRSLPPIEDLGEARIRQESIGVGIRLNLLLFAAGELYVAATPEAPHRPLLAALFAALAVIALLVARKPAEEIVHSPRREAFFLAWSLSTLTVVTTATALDGGISSPLALLFFVPVVFAALSYPLLSVVVLGGLSEIALVAVGSATAGKGPIPLGFFAGSLAMVAVLCAWQGHVQERRRLELAIISRSDPLTGCLNRRGFQERIEAELDAALRTGQSLAVVMLDIDSFKQINDTRGHAAGDEALRFTAQTLAGAARPMDAVGRLGGDEFAVLLPDSGEAAGREVAGSLRDALAEQLTAAAGVASFPADGVDAEELLAHADAELYAVKHGQAKEISPGRRELTWAAALARAVDLRMAVAEEHSRDVAGLVAAIAQRFGWTGADLALLRMAGLLHDIGKVAVPDRILRKNGSLTAQEFEEIKTHPLVGADLVGRVEGLDPILGWIAHSHEHFDGSGYPDGLAGEGIPLASRMMLVADAYAAMTRDRPYRTAVSHEEALEELRRCAGNQFDPVCVNALMAHLEEVGEDGARAG